MSGAGGAPGRWGRLGPDRRGGVVGAQTCPGVSLSSRRRRMRRLPTGAERGCVAPLARSPCQADAESSGRGGRAACSPWRRGTRNRAAPERGGHASGVGRRRVCVVGQARFAVGGPRLRSRGQGASRAARLAILAADSNATMLTGVDLPPMEPCWSSGVSRRRATSMGRAIMFAMHRASLCFCASHVGGCGGQSRGDSQRAVEPRWRALATSDGCNEVRDALPGRFPIGRSGPVREPVGARRGCAGAVHDIADRGGGGRRPILGAAQRHEDSHQRQPEAAVAPARLEVRGPIALQGLNHHGQRPR